MLKLKWNPAPNHVSDFFVLFSYNNLSDIFDHVNFQVTVGASVNCGKVIEDFRYNLLLEFTSYWKMRADLVQLSKMLKTNKLVAIDYSNSPLYKGDLDDGTFREVYPIFSDANLSFRAGLTIHGQYGTWSSLPHHFEREEILRTNPIPFFEKFAYITNPEGEEGIQTRVGHLYKAGHKKIEYDWTNDLVSIHDKNIVDIPLGSHAVTGGPGVRLAYFWVYADYNNLRGREKFEDSDTSD